MGYLALLKNMATNYKTSLCSKFIMHILEVAKIYKFFSSQVFLIIGNACQVTGRCWWYYQGTVGHT